MLKVAVLVRKAWQQFYTRVEYEQFSSRIYRDNEIYRK